MTNHTRWMLRRTLLLGCVGLLLAGCATQEPRSGNQITDRSDANAFLQSSPNSRSSETRLAASDGSSAAKTRPAVLAVSPKVADAPTVRIQPKTRRSRSGLLKVSAPAGVRGDYSSYPALARFASRMESEGFKRADIERLFSAVERQQWIIDYMNTHAPRPSSQSTRPNGSWLRYRAKFIKDSNLSVGSEFWRRHATTLARAEKTYGVPAEYIVAILGVETRWGGYMGSHRIIDALATLAFDYPRRSALFTDELAHYLIMARDEGFDPLRPIGSFAGAMGLGQFMPSSFHRYAVDFDGNGHRDLWDTEDAIGSVANYFKGYGWRSGQPVAVRVPSGASIPVGMKNGFDSDYSESQLTAVGINKRVLAGGQRRLSLLRLDMGSSYQYWVGFDNFYVISRYNHSTYYAMAVHQLAQALRERRGLASRTRITKEVPPVAARS